MKNSASGHLFAYWSDLRGNETAPLKSDIDAVALRRLLSHLFIVAINEDQTLEFRLAGTQICDLFGRELKGEPFSSLWFTGEDERAADIAASVIGAERPASISVAMYRLAEILPYEMLLLPLRPQPGQASDRFLGALLPKNGQIVRPGVLAEGLIFEDWSFLDEDGFCATETVEDEHWSPATAASRLLRLFPLGRHP